jgi:hypothetical protein
MSNRNSKFKIQNSKAIIIIALVSAMMMASCTHQSAKVAAPEISFSTDIIPILTTYCALNGTCHMGASSLNQYTNFDSDSAYYTISEKNLVSVANPGASLLYAEVEQQEMPLQPYAPLSAANQSLILEWIQQGAKNN